MKIYSKKSRAYLKKEVPFWWFCLNYNIGKFRRKIRDHLEDNSLAKKTEWRKLKPTPLEKNWTLRDRYNFERCLKIIPPLVERELQIKKCGVRPLED